MVNAFESKVARFFREKGYYTILSAGSRGVADIVAVRVNEVLFIQCKNSRRLSPSERERLKQTTSDVGARGLFVTHKRGRILIQEI